jgi:molecular chaperone GrpE (heat shock protein)
MNPGDERAEVSLSNEFFKKLNQQIVQKDNLIKLLQLQIKNLKSQVDDGAADGQKKGDLQKALDTREAEIQRLQADLAQQKGQLESLVKEKDEQIQSLNQLLADHQQQVPAAVEVQEDPRVPELTAAVEALKQDLAAAGQSQEELAALRPELEALRQEVDALRQEKTALEGSQSDAAQALSQEVADLKAALAEAQQLAAAHAEAEQQIADLSSQLEASKAELAMVPVVAAPSPDALSKIAELEQDVQTLKNLLAEKDEQIAHMSSANALPAPAVPDPAVLAELEQTKAELEQTKAGLTQAQSEIEAVKTSSDQGTQAAEQARVEIGALKQRLQEQEQTIAELSEKAQEAAQLRERLSRLEGESAAFSETALKLTALENERERLALDFESQKQQFDQERQGIDELNRKLDDAHRTIAQKEVELSAVRLDLESAKAQTQIDTASRSEIELLSNQVADQLLNIQKFEGILRSNHEQIKDQEEEIAELKQKLSETDSGPRPIQISSGNEVIANFIDFFDGLDSFLSQNPNAELQSLHRKLLERLIIPNQIQYLPVVSEPFDGGKHIATDYFRSDRFPEKCVVFEVEKGYRQGDLIVKKAKVWVVQNLFECRGCNAVQSNADSRFCHLCGLKMVAPNGLPVDSLPAFDPTPTTYLRFAERMLEKYEETQERPILDQAKTYLLDGMNLDSNFVPILIRLADVHALNSEFPEAITMLQRASMLKPDPKVSDKIKNLEVQNTILKQAVNLSPEELKKLMALIQK